ncbi:MAG TPA: 2-isopropylmalate synthase [Myxococcota bacterium]|nr:2-isopropylmalate synthase [Myxococcota bacterium]
MSGEIIFDWNRHGRAAPPRPVAVHDETLRDGLQSPTVTDPTLDQKAQIVRLLDAIGVESAALGLPGSSPRARREITALVRQIRDEGLRLRPAVSCRTHADDLGWATHIAEATGTPLEVMMFLGASPIRMHTEGWDEDELEVRTRKCVRFAVRQGLSVAYVTEDTTRSRPETLRRLFLAAIDEGARRLVLCDTVGFATPDGARALVRWTRALLGEAAPAVQIDWHGHNDRGLALVNALAAAEAGADRVHATVLGIGERVGNTALDQVLVNLRLDEGEGRDLTRLAELGQLVSEATGTPLPASYPVLGADAFRTATGAHAAAVIKALRRGDAWLADRVYSGVPARWVGREQQIAVGFMSGQSNARFWLEEHGFEATDGLIRAILEHAKDHTRVLTDGELLDLVARHRAPGG